MEEEEKIIKEGKIKYKSDYYFLYEKGFLGNKPLTWNSLDEIAESGWEGRICIRGKKGIARSKSKFDCTIKQAGRYIEKLRIEGIPPEQLTFNQSMPDEHLIVQGEFMRIAPEIYNLIYTTVKKPMNRALEEETLDVRGLTALNLVKGNLFPSSYDDLQLLFDLFPDSVIEFSAYDICVGNLPNRNTIMWEVRNY